VRSVVRSSRAAGALRKRFSSAILKASAMVLLLLVEASA